MAEKVFQALLVGKMGSVLTLQHFAQLSNADESLSTKHGAALS